MATRIVALLTIFGLVGCSGLVAAPGSSSTGDGPSSTGSTSGPPAAPVANAGTVQASVVLPGGMAFGPLNFNLDNATTHLAGAAHVGDSPDVTFSIDEVAAGAGYTLRVASKSSDDSVTCTGTSPPFSVQGQQVTQVNVTADCTTTSIPIPPLDTSHCPVWNTLVADPPMVPVAGGSSLLEAMAAAPDPVIAFAWSASAGTIHDAHQTATSSTAIFTCPATSGGTVVVTLVVTDPLYPDASCPPFLGVGNVTVVCPAPIVVRADAGDGEDAGPPGDAGLDASLD
jgi:hypothetical protein